MIGRDVDRSAGVRAGRVDDDGGGDDGQHRHREPPPAAARASPATTMHRSRGRRAPARRRGPLRGRLELVGDAQHRGGEPDRDGRSRRPKAASPDRLASRPAGLNSRSNATGQGRSRHPRAAVCRAYVQRRTSPSQSQGDRKGRPAGCDHPPRAHSTTREVAMTLAIDPTTLPPTIKGWLGAHVAFRRDADALCRRGRRARSSRHRRRHPAGRRVRDHHGDAPRAPRRPRTSSSSPSSSPGRRPSPASS